MSFQSNKTSVCRFTSQTFLYVVHLSVLVSIGMFVSACEQNPKVVYHKKDQPLQKLTGPVQTAEFELRASHTGELIATGFSLRPIAQSPAPVVADDKVQATDVLFTGDLLLASYNFKGEPHKGALQVIDVSDPENPILRYEMNLPNVDLNRIRLYQDRYLVVAAGDASDAATLEVFDIQDDPQLVASLDLPSRQTTMVSVYQNYALVTTGDDGGVLCIDLSTPSDPELISYYPLADARYVEVLSEEEVLLVSGGTDAALTRLSWHTLTQGRVSFSSNDESPSEVSLSLSGLTVGAPSWGFKVGDRFHLSADEQGLMTFSLANQDIVETGLVATQGDANAGVVSSDGRFALLANGQEGLVVLDVQNGHPTQLLAQFDTPGDHGSANAVAMRGTLVALADGLGGVKLLDTRLLRRGGRIATLLLNFVDAGISRTLAENLIHDASTYVTPTLSPRILYVLDDFNNGEHSADPPLTQSILEELSFEFDILDEPVDGLSPADVDGYDLVWFANPGWYVEDAASVDTLISFSAQGGGIVLQGDDMTHRRTGESLLSELTGLEFVTNGTRTCNVRTNNQLGAQYRVEVQDQYHPLVRSSLGTSFLYGDDIDHSIPMNVGEKVLAWATLDGDANCEVRVPAIVAWDPSQLNHHSNLLLSAKNQSRLGTDSTLLKDGDVVHYKQETDEAHILLTEDIFRTANGEMGSNEEIDALHYIPSNGHYLLSTRAHAYLGQPLVAIRPGDIVEYDPVQDQAQIIFSQDLFRKANGEPANAANVDALFQSDSNTLYLSTKHIERLGVGEEMLTFKKGDVVRYDISQDQASLFISADDLFRRNNGESGGTGDIDALHVISDHKIVFSSLAAEFVGLNHLAVKDGDLVIYDITTQQASLYMSESVFRKANGQQGAQADIDAITLTSFISP